MPRIGINIRFKANNLPVGYAFVIDSIGRLVTDYRGYYIIARI